MAVRYLNATGTQALINEIKSRLALKADLTSLQSLQEALDTVASSIPTNVSQLSNDAEYVTATQVGDTYATKASVTGLSELVTQNQDAINLLNANAQTQGSVDYKIAQAMSSAGTPFYDTAQPGTIPEWLAQLPANANLASMYIHPTANVNGFVANRHYFAWMMKTAIEGAEVWVGIALGSWTGAQSRAQHELYEIEADANNYVALSHALTGGVSIPEVTLTTSLAPLFELPADVKMARVVCSDQGVPAILRYGLSAPREMNVRLKLIGIAEHLAISGVEAWQLNGLHISDTNDSSLGTLLSLYAFKESDNYVLQSDTGAIIPHGWYGVISSAEIRSLFV